MSEKLMVCKALAAMIRNHGEPNEEEINFVAHAAFEMNLTPEENEEVQTVLKDGGEYQGFIDEVTSRAMRTFLFRRVVAATLIDEEIEEDELDIINKTIKTFGYDENVVKEYLDWMKAGIAWEKQGQDLMSRLQPAAPEVVEESPPPFEK